MRWMKRRRGAESGGLGLWRGGGRWTEGRIGGLEGLSRSCQQVGGGDPSHGLGTVLGK